jgi:hypothetical protein
VYPPVRCFNPSMAGQPLCPVVLSMLAASPRRPHEVAQALSSGYPAARTTLDRLRDGGLVRERPAPAGPLYVITRRGRGELALQRMLWRGVISAGAGRQLAAGH